MRQIELFCFRNKNFMLGIASFILIMISTKIDFFFHGVVILISYKWRKDWSYSAYKLHGIKLCYIIAIREQCLQFCFIIYFYYRYYLLPYFVAQVHFVVLTQLTVLLHIIALAFFKVLALRSLQDINIEINLKKITTGH